MMKCAGKNSKAQESIIQILPQLKSSSQYHEVSDEVANSLPPPRQNRCERQLVQSRLRWSVVVDILEAKLISVDEKSRTSDCLGIDELRKVTKDFNLSESEVRKIWNEYTLQRKQQRDKKPTHTDSFSMISNEHQRAVRNNISDLQWTRAAWKKKADGDDKCTHYRPRFDDCGKLWNVHPGYGRCQQTWAGIVIFCNLYNIFTMIL